MKSKLANDTGAINLSQGFPDFDVDPELRDLVLKYMVSGHNQYAPMQGVPALRQHLSEKTKEMYGASNDPDTEITVTSGATEAIFSIVFGTATDYQRGVRGHVFTLSFIRHAKRSAEHGYAQLMEMAAKSTMVTDSIGSKLPRQAGNRPCRLFESLRHRTCHCS